MALQPTKFVIDTNVPKIANLATKIEDIPDNELECALACVEFIERIMSGNILLVIDAGGEVFDEYRRQLSMSGQPGVGDAFVQWLHDQQWKFPDEDRIELKKLDTTYSDFPNDERLANFDPSDRKFVAISNAHRLKPPIVVASDHTWWTHKEVLFELGIPVQFLCPDRIEQVSIRKTGGRI